MVESIGTKPVTTDRSAARISATTPVPAIRTPVAASSSDVAQAGSLAQSLAAAPPVDLERIARVKQAIADGTFPILPGTIADNIIALRLQLTAKGKN